MIIWQKTEPPLFRHTMLYHRKNASFSETPHAVDPIGAVRHPNDRAKLLKHIPNLHPSPLHSAHSERKRNIAESAT